VSQFIKNQCNVLKKPNNTFFYKEICEDLEDISNKEILSFFKKNFFLVPINNLSNLGLMTGYYEPELKAFMKKGKERYPVYINPEKLQLKGLSKKTRAEINAGALENKGLEIAWAESEIEVFFLHVQGSGRLKLDNGKTIKVRYAGNNDKKYTSIGKVLIDENKIKKENISMFTIKNWLYENHKEARKIMERNERYIYFEEYKGNIKGSSNFKLKPDISIAVDPKFHKPGKIFIIKEANNISKPFLVIAHDRGSAIKGKNRIDLFTGFGKKAEKKAAELNSKILIWELKTRKF